MQKLTQLTVAASGYKTRKETFDGREHLVVPVVALVQGVVHAMNAKTAEFVSASEFSRAPGGWNGRPLFFGHPLNAKGSPVSGNSPDVLEEKAIGRVFNSLIKSNKLTMEAWIDIDKAKDVAPEILERVEAGDSIEISVGVFVETDDSEGEYKGKKYLGEWHDIVPDHLALLAKTDEGACSVEMGCGVRAAGGNGNNQYKADNPTQADTHAASDKADKATKKAEKSGSAADHSAAADAHQKAADMYKAAYSPTLANIHQNKASDHRSKASGTRAAGSGEVMEHMYTEWLESGPETDELLKTLRNIPQKERDKIPAGDFAGPNQSFPITEPVDVHDAAQSLGRAKGNKDTIKSKIISIAYRKGETFVAELPDDWKKKKDQKNAIGRAFTKVLSMFRAAQPSNEMSNGDLTRKLYEAVRLKVGGNLMNIEAFVPVTDPNRVIYTVYEPAVEAGMGYPYTSYVMYERQFTLDASGNVTVADGYVEVEAVLSYEPVLMAEDPAEEDEPTAAKGARNSKGDLEKIQAMHDHSKALGATCDPKVMGNGDTTKGASCSCKQKLAQGVNGMENELEKIQAYGTKLAACASKADAEKVIKDMSEAHNALQAYATTAKPKEEPTAAAAVVVTPKAEEKPPTLDQLLALSSKDVQDAHAATVKVANDAKAATIKSLKDTGRCTITDLESKSQAELDQLLALTGAKPVVAAAVDFGGQGSPKVASSEKSDVPAPPDMNARILASRKK